MNKRLGNIPIMFFSSKKEKEQFALIDYFIKRTKNTKENLITIITTHILVEFILNRILENKYQGLENERFYKKVKILYVLKEIPIEMKINLDALNDLRNQYAHRLKPDKNEIISICKKFTFCNIVLGQEKINKAVEYYDFFRGLCSYTIATLFSHFRNKGINFSF